jgi:hypothetical protein
MKQYYIAPNSISNASYVETLAASLDLLPSDITRYIDVCHRHPDGEFLLAIVGTTEYIIGYPPTLASKRKSMTVINTPDNLSERMNQTLEALRNRIKRFRGQ